MASFVSPLLLGILSGAILVVGVSLISVARSRLRRLRIPGREDDDEGFERADRILGSGRLMLRTGDVLGVLGTLGLVVAILMYVDVI